MKIRNKIQLFSTVWLVVIVCIINASIYGLFYKQMTDQERERLAQQTRTIAEMLQSPGNQAEPAPLLQALLGPNAMIRVINAGAHAVVTATKELKYGSLPVRYQDAETYRIAEVDGAVYAIGQVPLIWKDGTIVSLEVTASLSDMQETLRMLRVVLALATLVVLLPSFIAGRILANVLLGPIHSMIRTMEEIQRRGILKKLELRQQSKDELYQLGNTFNRMIDILQMNFAKQQQFVSDASHELRTPLTVIEGYATLLKRWGMKKQDVLEEAVEVIYAEAVRMKKLTKQMLLLANPEEEASLSIQRVNLVALGEETGRWMTQTYGRPIAVDAQSREIWIEADEQKLKQLLVILLDNALTYSNEAIDLVIAEQPLQVSMSVTDRGVGIPPEDVPHIFERFYRVDKARTRETGGTGLGLSIAKRLVDAHGGRIEVVSEVGRGTTFTVILPRTSDAAGGMKR
ncbi:MAG: ATP-binding protein [Clostridia bacterium]